MKSHVQEVKGAALSETWTDSLPTYYKDCKNFKVGNFQQQLPFHYVEKDWLTDKMIKQMESFGMNVIPVSFRDVYAFGGSLHCATTDVYREGECEDYFPNQ